MIYRPENVLFMGIGVYLAVFFLSPLEVRVPIETGSFAYIALTIATLMLGSRLADQFRLGGVTRPIPAAQLQRMESRLFFAMLWLGGLGNLVKLVDKYMLRGVGSLTGLEAREMMVDAGTSSLSVVGSILYPFGYLPIFILLGAKVMPRKKWKLLLAGFIFLIPALDALTLLSRSFMLVTLAMIYFGASLSLYKGHVVPPRLLLFAVGGVGLVLTISVLTFNWRLDQMSFNLLDSIFVSAYAYTVVPDASAQALINDGGLLVGLLPVAQYYVHSILEFQIIWSLNETQVFSGGALLFAPYVKFLAMLGLATEPNLFDLFPRVGIFTSFWGPLWVDFGWLGPLVTFLFGLMARTVARAARIGDLRAYPLYTYFCVILFFMPVVNFAISAQGMYVINAFALFWFLARKTGSAVPV